MVFPNPMPSHSILGTELTKGIARKHNVTFITPYTALENINNVTFIVVEEIEKHTKGKKYLFLYFYQPLRFCLL